MESQYSELPRNVRCMNPSEHIQLCWPENDTSMEPVDIISGTNQSDGDRPAPIEESLPTKRIFSGPQVTVNVFGGSSAGGSGAGWSGTGGAATINRGAVGDFDDPIGALTCQLSALSDKVKELSSRRVIDSKVWNTTDVRSPQRETQGRISFSEKFETTPAITVSVFSLDVSQNTNCRVKVYATEIDAKGFTVHVEIWSDTNLYSCGVS